ncbi:peptidyl-prolyl cis-trans isomerase [Corallococcus sp. H22C18031201]|nr:peptidyl-prolyl cis-trans isomerase [Corallococcus sp. H22C18031201]
MRRLPVALFVRLALLSSLAGCAHSNPASPGSASSARARQDIARWEDQRSLGDGQLVAWAVGGEDPSVRARALRALARIQDVSTLTAVVAGLTAPAADVRDEAAFAAGELALSWEPLPETAREQLTTALIAAEAQESEGRVRASLVEALGKLGTGGAIRHLTGRMTEGSPEWRARAALALGVVARRGGAAGVREVPMAPAAQLLAAGLPEEARYAGAYLLANLRRAETLSALRTCLSDSSPDVRALCAKGVGDVGGPEDAATLGALLSREPTPRVAAEAARALAKLTASCSGPCLPLDALKGVMPSLAHVARGEAAWSHPVLAIAQLGLPGFARPLWVALRKELSGAMAHAGSEVARGDLAWLDCRVAAAMDHQTGALSEVLRCGDGRVAEPRRLALGLREVARSQGAGGADFAVALLSHPDSRVRLAALEAVAERPVPSAAEPVRALLEGTDLVEAGAAASVAGRLKDAQALPAVERLAARVAHATDLAEPVAGALVALKGKGAEPLLREWLHHPHANVRRVAADALTELTGQPVRSARVALPGETLAPTQPAGARLRFHTAKGTFDVRLDTDEAPVTSGNLLALARRGYFQGVAFHRVVPDFVAQGGDPRGDGEGGPGYSIRCEMTRRLYRRGVVGMALSGKDTGGSQFFFTHAPQPHLDGRYTAFGEVVSGMDVVDGLLEGDVMTSVEVIEPGA